MNLISRHHNIVALALVLHFVARRLLFQIIIFWITIIVNFYKIKKNPRTKNNRKKNIFLSFEIQAMYHKAACLYHKADLLSKLQVYIRKF